MSEFSKTEGQPPIYVSVYQPASPGPRRKLLWPLVLLLITVATTLVAGFLWHVGFESETPDESTSLVLGLLRDPLQLLTGLWFSVPILVILLAHETGHYLTCRRHRLNATLPYVIPAPPGLNPFGTFGAVIRIRSPFENRLQLFDVGISGPLVGFVFLIPALVFGLLNSKEFLFSGPAEQTLEFGEPLLFRLAAAIFYTAGDGSSISLHPVGWAAWFGMLATSINLLPIGQLDGGHIVYALFGARGHRIVSYMTFGALVGVSFLSWPMVGYLVFAMVVMILGFRHPRPYTEYLRPGRGRVILAVVALLILILTFIAVPVRFGSDIVRL